MVVVVVVELASLSLTTSSLITTLYAKILHTLGVSFYPSHLKFRIEIPQSKRRHELRSGLGLILHHIRRRANIRLIMVNYYIYDLSIRAFDLASDQRHCSPRLDHS